MKKWVITFWIVLLAATLGGTAYVLYRFWNYLQHVPALWQHLNLIAWVILGAATVLFYYLEYLKLYLLLSILDFRLGLARGLKVLMASEFASILTPTAELHMPASVLLLNQAGVPAAKATAAVTMKTSIGVVWVCTVSPILLFAHDDIYLPRALATNFGFVLVPIAAIVIFYAAMILFGSRVLQWSQVREQCSHSSWNKSVYGWVGRSARNFSVLGTSTDIRHLYVHLLTLAHIITYSFVGYWICRSLGIDYPFLTALTIFSTSLMIDYVAPIPGSIGVNEFFTAYMIDRHVSTNALFVAILLRICCKYIVILPGSLFTIIALRARSRESLG